MTPRPARSGFTLLEMILALLIGALLMTALYATLSSQVTHAQAGRDALQDATLARSILARLSSDIVASLGPYDPRMQADSSTSAASSEPSSAQTGAANSSNATSTPPPGESVKFNIGVLGEANQLTLTVGRVPVELFAPDKLRLDANVLEKVCGLRRVTYWIVEGNGLYRQELSRVTSTDIDSEPTELDQGKRFASEVKSITFQYWDGSSWTTNWDSSTPGADGDTPIGPPAAIEIVIELSRPYVMVDGELVELEPRRYRHVVALPTGNNYSTPQ
jgi:prepilin-type N-terminal cleavage/methylation domain-containing protein